MSRSEGQMESSSATSRPPVSGAVVVGVDGSDSAEVAVRWAAALAAAEGRVLVLACGTAEPGPLWLEPPMVHPFDYAGAIRDAAQRNLESAHGVAHEAAPDLEIREILEAGDPRSLLLELSQSAAMVVVGSSGRGPLRRVMLGSVGVAVVRRSSCPAVVVPSGRPPSEDHRVVVGTDGSEAGAPVLEFAADQAARRGVPLVVVLCRLDVARWTGRPGADQGPDPAMDALESRLAALRARHPGVTTTVEVTRDWPQGGLLTAAEGADLLVVGHEEVGLTRRFLLGSVAVSVVENATCPVAVVPLGPREGSA